MKRIGVFTSGGDAPGMNAAVRGVVRMAIYHGLEVFGIQYGYRGMMLGDIQHMYARSVSNIIQRGGTILKSARSQEFMTREGREKAYETLRKHNIEGLVGIGGDGTFRGLSALVQESEIKVIGVPGTIDNDLYGTDFTIGYDTAINTAMYIVDKIRDTADAHDRLFFIEVMGRDSGFIALDVGVSCGAEYIAIPETVTNVDELQVMLKKIRKDKSSAIIIVAEGDDEGGAFDIARKLKDFSGYDFRVSILGHIQRGGSPTARDRVLAGKLGAASVERLKDGINNVMVGEINGRIIETPLEETWMKKKEVDKKLLKLSEILSL
jgi:6-phosphofructokinase 1